MSNRTAFSRRLGTAPPLPGASASGDPGAGVKRWAAWGWGLYAAVAWLSPPAFDPLLAEEEVWGIFQESPCCLGLGEHRGGTCSGPGSFEGRVNLLLCPAVVEYETARKESKNMSMSHRQRCERNALTVHPAANGPNLETLLGWKWG